MDLLPSTSKSEDNNDESPVQMLDYENEMFLEILQKDGLVVTAKGILIDVVLTNLLKVYCDPGNLVFVINHSEYDEKYYAKKLNSDLVHTASLNVNEREEQYLSGGVHFVTTRIMVVDLLKKRVPIEKITGMVVLRAHTVLESCQEAFVLRLYRQNNKTGFIKAFSNGVESFTVGFGHVERIMQSLLIKELFIWPRFHSLIRQCFKSREPVIIELHVPVPNTIRNIQAAILDIMNNTVKELKRINKSLEMQEITVENCVAKKFHKILQAQLDCVWHQLSAKSKQLIADLKTLRYLIMTALHNDPVTFYSVIGQHRSMEYAQTATWLLQDSAEQLFNLSNQLVYSSDGELNPQCCPKWNVLYDILRIEIPSQATADQTPKILILCQDRKTCFQLNQCLMHGPDKFLFTMCLKHKIKYKKLAEKLLKYTGASESPPKKQAKVTAEETLGDVISEQEKRMFEDLEREYEDSKTCYVLTMSQALARDEDGAAEANDASFTFEAFPEMENMDLTTILEKDPMIVIQTLKRDNNALALQDTLNDLQPNYVIMYDSSMTAIRQIELFEARKSERCGSCKVYFLIYTESVEEQSYLTTLRREKEAFEHLIKMKSTMVIPDYQDGKSSVEPKEMPAKNTRRGGASCTENAEPQRIIVDMREFRSDLPALIHKRGIQIEPVTISVGDYILTPEVCVERKSISDLVGSLNSGRLFQQCTQMARYYAKPMLLIEFDQNQPFHFQFQGKYMISNEAAGDFATQKKLQLLTIHFPRLKLVWSPSPYASAQLFEELKEGKEQPSTEYAKAMGSESDLVTIDNKYNTSVYDFVSRLPGVSSRNIKQLLAKCKSMANMAKLTQEQLRDALGSPSDAKLLYSIIHERHTQPQPQPSTKGAFRKKFSRNT